MCSAATAPALVLASIGAGSHGEFVPHVSVTVTLGLTVVDLAVLIYFIHHTAVSIQHRADVQRSYEAVLIVESRLTASGRNV
ncbi:MAG TPA: DUF2254 family protein [Streptosporangiaceae bacterium]|nr:DUF2254 family protein [Streptosporangiaceae bacterium]